MSSVVTAIIAAGKNWTIDYSAEACDVVIKVFMRIKIAWDWVENMFATVLTRSGFNIIVSTIVESCVTRIFGLLWKDEFPIYTN